MTLISRISHRKEVSSCIVPGLCYDHFHIAEVVTCTLEDQVMKDCDFCLGCGFMNELAHLLLCYLLLHSRVGPLAQSLQGPNSNCYTSNCLKYSPNKHMFSYFEPALHTPWHCTQHLLALDKTNPGAIKDPRLLLHFRAPWPRDSHLGWKTSSRH